METKVLQEKTANIKTQLSKVIVENDDIKNRLVWAMLTDSNIFLEGMPGTAKTLLIEALQSVVSGSVAERVQMTADIKPNDLLGTEIYNLQTGKWVWNYGQIIGINFLLIDEINRATPRAQSALLQAMEERKVSLITMRQEEGKEAVEAQSTRKTLIAMPDPFLLMATQNPIEQEGTYPLPEAQLDRFGMKLNMGYISFDGEMAILGNANLHGRDRHRQAQPAISVTELIAARQAVLEVKASEDAQRYIVHLIRATRPQCPAEFLPELKDKVRFGGSVRPQIGLLRLCKAKAFTEGRNYILPDDIKALAPDVLRHRILLSDEAKFSDDGVTADEIVSTVLKKVHLLYVRKNFVVK